MRAHERVPFQVGFHLLDYEAARTIHHIALCDQLLHEGLGDLLEVLLAHVASCNKCEIDLMQTTKL